MEHKEKEPDWESDLGDFLLTKNIYRTDYLNKQLIEIVKEWKSYIEKFDGISVELDDSGSRENSNSIIQHLPPAVSLRIKIRTRKIETLLPFIISSRYITSEDHGVLLSIRYSIGYDGKKYTDGRENEAYIFAEEKHIDDDLFSATKYVQQTINNIFKKQFNNIENH